MVAKGVAGEGGSIDEEDAVPLARQEHRGGRARAARPDDDHVIHRITLARNQSILWRVGGFGHHQTPLPGKALAIDWPPAAFAKPPAGLLLAVDIPLAHVHHTAEARSGLGVARPILPRAHPVDMAKGALPRLDAVPEAPHARR